MRHVTRSSAVYYFARHDDFRTQLIFMNYWAVKRGLTDVVRHLTLRDMAGVMLFQSSAPIAATGGHVIEIDDILDGIAGAPAEGSVELEFTSANNLAIAYPAAIVRYVGRDWHTVAHASQRFYSETSGDDAAMIGTVQRADEGNITIHEDPDSATFVIIHNGPVAVAPEPLAISIFSADGRQLSGLTDAIGWQPYQTRRLRLSDLIDHREFLGGQRGTFSLSFLIAGVFPRLIGGHERHGRWSIDHTNFAAITGPAAADVVPVNGAPAFKDLVFNLPNNSADDWQCFADIYPTYPSDDYTIEVRRIDRDSAGEDVVAVPVRRGGSASFPRIVFDNHGAGSAANLELLFRHRSELPRRFHTGIHYRIGDGLPGFLTDGPLPHSTPAIRTRWFPVFEPTATRNFLLMANRTIGDEAPAPVRYGLQLFNSFGDAPLVAATVLGEGEARCVRLDELFPAAAEFLGDRPGWVYMTAEHPQRAVLHYASVRGRDSIAVCHAF